MPSGGVTIATGSPSITTFRRWRARRPRWSSRQSPATRRTMRVGAGGIMLPNHSPLVIAEQFGTLESLFACRIDLALGRAPGSDQITARALRRQPGDCRHVSAGRARAHHVFPGTRRATRAGDSRRRLERADLDTGIEPVRRATRGRARLAVCVRVAFRARAHDGRHRRLPAAIPCRRSFSRNRT